MKLSHQFENKTCIVSLDGDIQLNDIEILRNECESVFEDRSIVNFIVNLKNVDLLSSAGIAAILLFQRRLNERQSQLALCELSPGNWEIANICGLDETVRIYPTLNDAKAALKT